MKHIHILGICGTFMGSLAVLAKQKGYKVTGSDKAAYPPMGDQLREQGITLLEGYESDHLKPAPDMVIIGNALSRGNPAVEYVLEQGIPYHSGAQWMAEHLLRDRWVLAVAGTHGKTTTTSMLAWILEKAGLNPGFLIGGVPRNFDVSARLGSDFFVIEADEYDTAFFDKRSKFIHYHPKTAILNNLEFDHADIFSDLEAIEQQFHYFVRTIPSNGLIIHHAQDDALQRVFDKGCWTPRSNFSLQHGDWTAQPLASDGHAFDVLYHQKKVASVEWSMLGEHNVMNGLAAIAAAEHAGVSAEQAALALSEFKGVKRRLEVRGVINGVTVYDDFAHHPTAIQTTLAGLRQRVSQERIIAVLEFASNTMEAGFHDDAAIAQAFGSADHVILLRPKSDWDVSALLQQIPQHVELFDSVEAIVDSLTAMAKSNDHIILMSNKAFGGIHNKLLASLE